MMKRYTITDLVSLQYLGFIRQVDAIQFYKKLQPLEKITCRSYPCDKPDVVIIESKNYKSEFDISQVELLSRLFKGADTYLAETTTDLLKGKHLLVFSFGQGYFALLTPFRESVKK